MLNKRAQNLMNALPENARAALILTPANRFYFLDLDTHDAGALLILRDKMVFIIDSRYMEVAKVKTEGAVLVLEEDWRAQLQEILAEENIGELYVENGITVGMLELLTDKLQNVEIIHGNTLSKTVLALRAIKDEDEINRVQQAQNITDLTFTHILPFIKEGVREIDLMLEMEHFARSNGAEKMAFETICVAGANSSRPHGVPGENRVKPGDFITMDFGALYKGYCADMTRTVALGHVGDEQKKVYDLVLQAHLAGIAAAKDGVRGDEVDKVARDIIYGGGYEGYFGHGLGHAVGIDIHEDPRFSPKSTDVIKANMVMTVEPGCYLPARFGCRIEDMVLITETGCRPMPSSPKELIVL